MFKKPFLDFSFILKKSPILLLISIFWVQNLIAETCIWIPPGVKVLRGLYIDQNTGDYHNPVCSGSLVYNGRHEAFLKHNQFAFVSVATEDLGSKPWDTREKIQAHLQALATKTGHAEIVNLPIVSHGMSHTNAITQQIYAAAPERVIAFAIIHLSALSGNPADSQSMKTPGFYLSSDQDFLEINMANGFTLRKNGAQQFPASKGGIHSYTNADQLVFPFFEQCIQYRLPLDWDPKSGPVKLINFKEDDGWLSFGDETFSSEWQRIIPAGNYFGNRNNPCWIPTEYLACTYRAYQSNSNSVTMTSPSMPEGRFPAIVTHGSDLTVSASVTGLSVKSASLYDGDILLKTFTAAPYSYTSKNFAPGTHAFYLAVETVDGKKKTSHVCVATVTNPTNMQAVINNPKPWDRIIAGSSVPIEIIAKSYDASIAEVEIFENTKSLGKLTAAPYKVQWTASAAGEYTFYATAKNSRGDLINVFPVKVKVYPQAPQATLIDLSPKTGFVRPGEKIQCKAFVRDQYNYKINPQPTITWSVTGGGNVDQNGLFTAGANYSSTPVEIKASSGGLTAVTKVTVSSTIKVKFQPGFAVSPEGYLIDEGGAFADRKNGYSYGWDIPTRHPRSRRCDSVIGLEWQSIERMMTPFEPPWNKCFTASKWEIAVPNGFYNVKVGGGDFKVFWDVGQGLSGERPATFGTCVYDVKILAEDRSALSVTGYGIGSAKVEVKDGRLTLSTPYSYNQIRKDACDYSYRTKATPISYVEITPISSIPTTKGFYQNILDTLDGHIMMYRLFTPANYDPSKKYPIVTSYHGVGERGTDTTKLPVVSFNQLWGDDFVQDRWPSFVFIPQCPANELWVDIWPAAPTVWNSSNPQPANMSKAMAHSLKILEKLKAKYSLDPERFYVTGYSMGGFGTWDVITRYPNMFAAAAPVAGGTDPSKASLIKHMPIWTFHAVDDAIVPVNGTQEMVKALRNVGGNPIYTEYLSDGHIALYRAAVDPDLPTWMFSQRLGQSNISGPINLRSFTSEPTLSVKPGALLIKNYGQSSKVKLFNMQGMTIYDGVVSGNDILKVKTSSFVKGFYIVDITTNGKKQIHKVQLMK